MKKLILVATLLAGCATSQPPMPIEAADCGLPPTELHFETVKKGLETKLMDPASAQWKFLPVKGSVNADGTYIYGYYVYAQVNAKNIYGGYTGFQDAGMRFFRIEKGRELYCIDTNCHWY